MKAYLDASAVVAVAVGEPRWQRIAEVTAAGEPTMCSDEVRRVVKSWGRVEVASADIARATDFVVRPNIVLRLPDAIPIAIAERIGAPLLTTDRQQHLAAAALGLPSRNPLSDGTAP